MNKKLIQSILRADNILNVISVNNEDIGLKEIANKLGLQSSTAFYLINTLIETNYLIQNRKKYKLGPRNLELGNRYLDNLSIYKIGLPIAEEIAYKINECVLLYTLENNKFLELVKIDSTHSVQPTRIIIDANNANATAIGKILLSSFSKKELQEFVNNNKLNKFTENTITSFNQLYKELGKVRQNGYALDLEESDIGVNCIAAPIYDHKGELKSSMGCSIPSQRFSKNLITIYTPLLEKGAAEISRLLGYNEKI